MPRSITLFAALVTLGVASAAAAGDSSPELTPEKIAEVQRDEQKAADQVNKGHGDKKPSEMSADERREVIAEQQAAARGVLEKHKVDPKEYARRQALLSRDEREQVKAAGKGLEEREAAEKAAAQKAADAKAAPPPKEVVIRRGQGEARPVDLTDDDVADEDLPSADEGPAAEGAPEAEAEAGAEPAKVAHPHKGHSRKH